MDGHCEIALVLMPHAVHDVYMKKIKGHIISANKLYAVTFTESQAEMLCAPFVLLILYSFMSLVPLATFLLDIFTCSPSWLNSEIYSIVIKMLTPRNCIIGKLNY